MQEFIEKREILVIKISRFLSVHYHRSVFLLLLSTAIRKFEVTPSSAMNEQTNFSKDVPSSCWIKPKEYSTTRNQHKRVMPLLNLPILFLAANKVKSPPIIQIIILIIDSWD